MPRSRSLRGRQSDPRPRYRPHLLELEARLPLGDALLGVVAAASLLGTHAPPAATVRLLSPGEPGASATGAERLGSGLVLRSLTRPARHADGAFITAFGGEVAAPAWGFAADAFAAPHRPRLGALATGPQREQGADALPLLGLRAGEERVAPPSMLSAPLPTSDGALLATLAGLRPDEIPMPTTEPSAQQEAVRANFAQLPLSFEANVGQTDAKVDFLTRGPGYALYLSAAEATMVLHNAAPARDALVAQASSLVHTSEDACATDRCATDAAPPAVVRMQVLGGNPAASASGVDRLPGVVNYFLGNDPAKWHTGVATYGKVTYDDVYAGVDVVYYGNQNQLEYDFVVAPGADPSAIRLGFTGAERMEIDAAGDLVLHLGEPGGVSPGSILRQRAPVVYQEMGGRRQEVASRFVLEGQQVRFAVGAYDAGRPLVIDPVLSYSTYLGGSDSDAGRGIAVDPATGGALVTGWTSSPNFPTANPLQASNRGGRDVFVTRLNAAGSALVFSTYLGGSGQDEGYALAVDPATGDVLVTGWTLSTNFPTANPLQATCGCGQFIGDAFVARLNAAGSTLVYSTYLGGSSSDSGSGLAVDPASGDALVTGGTNSTNFPTANPLQATYGGGGRDVFVTRLNAAGSALVWSTYLGGSGGDFGTALAVDPASGDALVTGGTGSTNFPTANPLQASNRGQYDVFVTRLNAAGSALVFSTYLGGSGYDYGSALAVDPASGDALVTGYTASTNFPTANPLQASNRGGADVFVTRLNAAGSALVFSTYLGGSSSEDYGFAIAVDPATGDALVTGNTSSTDFPTANPLYASNRGGGDVFVTRLNPAGSALVFSTYLGGNSTDYGTALAVDPATGDALVTGGTDSTDFPTVNPLQPGLNGSGVFRSTNGASNWSRRNAAGLQNLALSPLLVDPQNPVTLYAISSGRVVKSTDGGDTWAPSGTGLGNRTITNLLIDPLTPSTLYAGIDNPYTDVGIFKSTDGGASWAPSYANPNHRGVTALAVDPVTPSTLYVGAQREEYDPKLKIYYYFEALYKSTNGGATWASSSTGVPENDNGIWAVAVDPLSPATVYAATTLGVYKSTNGGGTWAFSNTGLPGAVHLLTIARPVPTSLGSAPKISTLYAAAQNRVYKSTNNGGTWTLSSTGLPTAGISALVASPADSVTLYVGTSAGIYKSTNAGASWARADAGVTNPNVTALALAPSSPATLYASAATSGSDAFVAKISPS